MSGCNDQQKVQFQAETVSCGEIAPGIFKLVLKTVSDKNNRAVVPPKAGQFFMLRREPSKTLLCRPISVFRVEDETGALAFQGAEESASFGEGRQGADANERSEVDVDNAFEGDSGLFITFLILLKGQGTLELCSLKEGDFVTGIGPLGNEFPRPEAAGEAGVASQTGIADKTDDAFKASGASRVCIIGGGIGVAPVAGFASTLAAGSYDFYACFKSGKYGLEYVEPAKLVITTDDGSEGIKGMLPDAFTAEQAAEYSAVYACGPEPMLRYVQNVCAEAGVRCWLSMEARMACGVGACLGCTITTTEGNRRCCKDGPVFDGATLIFPERKPAASKKVQPAVSGNPELGASSAGAGGLLAKAEALAAGVSSRSSTVSEENSPDLSVTIAGVRFQNPVIAASGTFGYGSEYADLVDVNALGGICSKGLTLEPRAGNTGNRLVETPSALINSIGLENPGIAHFIEHELPSMLEFKAVTLANLSGSSEETYVEGAKLLDATDVPVIELNISCPNVKCGGMAFGLNPDTAAQITAAVRAATKKPLVVKLSPNAPDLVAVAHAVRKAGADAISLVNTFQATAINIETGRPVFDNIRAGLSGPGIKPIALRMVMDVCQSMKALPEDEQIPVIGLGGISTWQDTVEFIMAGASAIEVGTATFADPTCMNRIVDGLRAFMKRKGYKAIEEMRGLALN